MNPIHLAIIMDGNGRWAKQQGLSRFEGHAQGAEVAKEITQACLDLPIHTLTLYCFSSENWERPADEVEFLMKLLEKYLLELIPELNQHQVKCNILGNKAKLPEQLWRLIDDVESFPLEQPKMQLNLAISYGGREEIIQACQKIATQAKEGEIDPLSISEENIEKSLLTAGQVHPDLLIRTSGEKRISNFLLWQLAYTELYFTDAFWPSFTVDDLKAALEDFQSRDRRYGVKFG